MTIIVFQVRILHNWGYGTHVCPRRLFVVKMVVVAIILNYRIEWYGHVDRRPEPKMIEGQYISNPFQKIKVSKVTTYHTSET